MVATVAADLRAALDPVCFAATAGLTLDGWQATALRSPARRQLWLCSRQSGKSTTAAVAALHQARYTPGSLVLVISPSLRQSQEAFRKVLAVLRAVGEQHPDDAATRLSLELANGSRIVALPGSERTTRGFSAPALIVVDEAARADDRLFDALMPMMATSNDGRVLALTTPAGRRGFFYALWTEGGSAWARTLITARDCPRIGAAFLAEERRRLPASVYAAEYECSFAEFEDGAFRAEDIDAAMVPGLAPLSMEGF